MLTENKLLLTTGRAGKTHSPSGAAADEEMSKQNLCLRTLMPEINKHVYFASFPSKVAASELGCVSKASI